MGNLISAKKLVLLFSLSTLTLTSCKKDEEIIKKNPDPLINYDIPSNYSFSNVNYSGQTLRMIMLDSISNYLKLGNSGQVLNATLLKNMYANIGNAFNNAALDTCGKQLKNKTYTLDQSYFESLFDSVAKVSLAGQQEGNNGQAGIVKSSDGTKQYLMDANGFEYSQIIIKQLMGAVFYYQAVENYLGKLPLQDNSNVVAGEGTAMEHYCDEVFGYFGVPTDYPSNKTNLKYWGDYAEELDSKINCSASIMQSYIKLRAAISNKDYTQRDAMIIAIREQFEKIVAASAILELYEAKEAIADDALRNHYLSEALGFIKSMQYNSQKKISNNQINACVSHLGNNFYNITQANIEAAINSINEAYAFDLSKF